MSQPWWHIQFHRTDNGKCPYLEDFFLSLSGEDQKRIREKLAIVEQHGPNTMSSLTNSTLTSGN